MVGGIEVVAGREGMVKDVVEGLAMVYGGRNVRLRSLMEYGSARDQALDRLRSRWSKVSLGVD